MLWGCDLSLILGARLRSVLVLIGLLHLHRTLAYLLFVLALVNVGLTLARARSDARSAAIVGGITRFGVRMGGGLTVLGGVGLWAMRPDLPLSTGWTWASLILWLPVELCGSRLILPEVAFVKDGGQATNRMLLGTLGQLLLIAIIFGLMSARP